MRFGLCLFDGSEFVNYSMEIFYCSKSFFLICLMLITKSISLTLSYHSSQATFSYHLFLQLQLLLKANLACFKMPLHQSSKRECLMLQNVTWCADYIPELDRSLSHLSHQISFLYCEWPTLNNTRNLLHPITSNLSSTCWPNVRDFWKKSAA